MQRFFLLLLVASLLIPTMVAAETFGSGITIKESTQISAILSQPTKYVGKQVKVSGLIVDVCVARGCWLYIADNRSSDKLRVKVVNGAIVFPIEARGHQAEVEGIVEIFELSKEETIEQRTHQALEQGIKFDPASVTTGETFVRLRGLGAEIHGL